MRATLAFAASLATILLSPAAASATTVIFSGTGTGTLTEYPGCPFVGSTNSACITPIVTTGTYDVYGQTDDGAIFGLTGDTINFGIRGVPGCPYGDCFGGGTNGGAFGFSSFSRNSTTSLSISGLNLTLIQGAPVSGTSFAISAVPEASTWALMLFGFAGIGLAMRRKGAPLSPVTKFTA